MPPRLFFNVQYCTGKTIVSAGRDFMLLLLGTNFINIYNNQIVFI